jgi:predicted aspartyl protease
MMRRLVRVFIACGFFAVASFCGSAGAADCSTLQQLASIPLTRVPGADVLLVPVSINEQPRQLLLDTGGVTTQLTEATAKELGLPVMNSGMQLYDVNGNESHNRTRVRQFRVGDLNAHNIEFALTPNMFGENIAGLISLDLFTAYDMDIDFAGAKLGYFSPDHCLGKVVYWDENALTIVPVTLHDRHVTVPVTVDGQAMTAIIDTGASRTLMTFDTASHFFGLSANSPGVTPQGLVNGDPNRKSYVRIFEKLSFGGVDVTHPSVTLIDNVMGKNADRTFESDTLNRVSDNIHLPQLVIGMNILKHLHLYFAFKENNLYITPATAHGGATVDSTN